MLGDILREEREKQNLTVKDVERDTSIRSLYISSIEKGEYDVLPGEVYLKGFIKSYAEYLKLDGSAMLQQYHAEKKPAMPLEAKEDTIKSDANGNGASDANNYLKNDFRERVEKSRNTQKIIAGVVAAGVIFGGAYWVFGSDSTEPPKAVPAKAVTTPAANTKTKEAPAPTEKKYDDVEVTAKFSDKCWTKIIADDKTIFEGTVKSGEKLSWKATKQLVVTAGNAGAVEITHNGKSLGKLGNDGDVVSKKFSPDKVENAE
jgi:cytoskeletal protein RodZ